MLLNDDMEERQMRVDIHTHCKWSKLSELSNEYLEDMLHAAMKVLDVLVLTEHFDTLNFDCIYDRLDEIALYENGHYRFKELLILPGIEVDVAEGAHIVVIGELAAIRHISQALQPHRAVGAYIKLEQLLHICDELECVRIGAHPFREENSLYQLETQLLRRLDAFDLNGRDLYKYGMEMEIKVVELARQLDLPVVAGSDTHHFEQYGCVYNVFAEPIANAKQLRQSLRARTYHYCISDRLAEKVSLAEQEQRKIKQANGYTSSMMSNATPNIGNVLQ